MQVGNLVAHKLVPDLGLGIVTELRGVHCIVKWPDTWACGFTTSFPVGPVLEAKNVLEVVGASR